MQAESMLADMAQELKEVQAIAKAIYIATYRLGWYAMRSGKSYSACQIDGERDGWIASWDNDRALRAIGVR